MKSRSELDNSLLDNTSVLRRGVVSNLVSTWHTIRVITQHWAICSSPC